VDAFGPNGYQLAIVNTCDDVTSFTVDFEGPRFFFRNIPRRRRGGINGENTLWRNTRESAHIQWTVDASRYDKFGLMTKYDAPFGTGEGENGVTMTITP